MRILRCISLLATTLILAACVQEQQEAEAPPPAPRHPRIEGNFKSVSSADIREVLDVMRNHVIKEHGSSLPIYTIHVVDHNHVSICYWPNDAETWAYAERVKGKWRLSDAEVERVIVKGSNIPAG